MNRSKRPAVKLLLALLAFVMVAAACGDSDTEGSGEDGALRIALVAPSASDDLAFTQSMVDAINALDRPFELEVTDGTFIVEDAALAIRGYAEDGVDIVIAHGTQYGASLAEIAPDFPETTFIWGTSADTQGLDNVFAYNPAADEGGYVNGVLAAGISESGVIGVVGPIEAGDAVTYIGGFEAGALASGASSVNITYTGSFGDVALASEAAQAHLTNGVDVLTGTAQMVVGAVSVATENDIPWLATQANQTALSPDLYEPYLATIHSALHASASDQKSSTVSGVRSYAARSASAKAARTAADTPSLAAAEMLTSSCRACSASDSSRENVVRIVVIATHAITIR